MEPRRLPTSAVVPAVIAGVEGGACEVADWPCVRVPSGQTGQRSDPKTLAEHRLLFLVFYPAQRSRRFAVRGRRALTKARLAADDGSATGGENGRVAEDECERN